MKKCGSKGNASPKSVEDSNLSGFHVNGNSRSLTHSHILDCDTLIESKDAFVRSLFCTEWSPQTTDPDLNSAPEDPFIPLTGLYGDFLDSCNVCSNQNYEWKSEFTVNNVKSSFISVNNSEGTLLEKGISNCSDLQTACKKKDSSCYPPDQRLKLDKDNLLPHALDPNPSFHETGELDPHVNVKKSLSEGASELLSPSGTWGAPPPDGGFTLNSESEPFDALHTDKPLQGEIYSEEDEPLQKLLGPISSIKKKVSNNNNTAISKQTTGKLKLPSNFCHICLRRNTRVNLLACGNLILDASCTKAICEKCFGIYNWNWLEAVATGSKWKCTHCRGVCPRRATCHIYNRTNGRRAKRLLEKRASKTREKLLVGCKKTKNP